MLGAGGRENRELVLNGYKVTVLEDKTDGGDGGITIWKYCTLKMVNMVNFMYIVPKFFLKRIMILVAKK